MTMQYEQTQINLQPVMGLKTYLFDAASPIQTDVIFNTWATLLNVMTTVTGKKEILFAAPVSTIPPGTYDMTDITLVGVDPSVSAVVDDVIFQNLDGVRNMGLLIGTVANTSPVFSIIGGVTVTMQFINARFSVGALAVFPMFDIDGASTLNVFNTHTIYSSVNPGAAVFAVGALSTLVLVTSAVASGGNNYGGIPGSDPFVSGLGAVFIRKGSGDVYFAGNQLPLVPVILTVDDYDPAVLADWSAINPLSVQVALDRIAAVLTPIP